MMLVMLISDLRDRFVYPLISYVGFFFLHIFLILMFESNQIKLLANLVSAVGSLSRLVFGSLQVGFLGPETLFH